MKLLKAALAAAALCAFTLQPAMAADPVEGRQFSRLQMTQPTEQAGKVEVIEFFWFGCSHCGKLEPLLKSWVKQLPADVTFRKVPAILGDSWAPGARLYYTLEAMGLLDKLGDAVFDAMLNQRIKLGDDAVLFDWIARQGVDRQKFADTYKSFAVNTRVKKAADMTQEYGFGGVPAIIVGGKYTPGPELASYGEMLQVTDFLIAKNRAEIKKK